jgi:hypothetical protein
MRSLFQRKSLACLILLLSALAGALSAPRTLAQTLPVEEPNPGNSSQHLREDEIVTRIFFPAALNGNLWPSPFMAETYGPLTEGGTLLARARALDMGWLRMGNRISWRRLQPNPGDPIQWDLLTGFEAELRSLRSDGVSPLIVINDFPIWATVETYGNDGRRSTCAPVRPERFGDYAAFLSALVRRYSASEFNVHNWELGNEPDVDPQLVPGDSGFGCWGDEDDPEYYGGKAYGEMLKAVVPAMRAEDPRLQVWLGGLLLAAPQNTYTPQAFPFPLVRPEPQAHPELLARGIKEPLALNSHPENFFKGILAAGAAPYFDIVAYHWYPSYYPLKVDFDLHTGLAWDEMGGGAAGKAKFLRGLMADFGVDKPLHLNETGLGCLNTSFWCNPPDGTVYQAQADFLVRTFIRGLGQNLVGISWYALEDPGWRYLGLLDEQLNPRPTYGTYQQMISTLREAQFIGPVDFGEAIEAYAFQKDEALIYILWTKEDQVIPIRVPQTRYIEARSRDGFALMAFPVEGDFELSAGFSPIYLTLRP